MGKKVNSLNKKINKTDKPLATLIKKKRRHKLPKSEMKQEP